MPPQAEDVIDDCQFCAIVQDRSPANVVYADDSVVAFFPRKPAVPGHTLVIPRRHVRDIFSLSMSDGIALTGGVLKMSRAIKFALEPDGLNVINSAGEAASQSVFHVHVHVVPRWFDDPIKRIWPPSEPLPTEIKADLLDLLRDAVGQVRL